MSSDRPIPASLPYPFADLALARRLERAEGHASRRFVEARARIEPESRAAFVEVAGAYVMFDGRGVASHADVWTRDVWCRVRRGPR